MASAEMPHKRRRQSGGRYLVLQRDTPFPALWDQRIPSMPQITSIVFGSRAGSCSGRSRQMPLADLQDALLSGFNERAGGEWFTIQVKDTALDYDNIIVEVAYVEDRLPKRDSAIQFGKLYFNKVIQASMVEEHVISIKDIVEIIQHAVNKYLISVVERRQVAHEVEEKIPTAVQELVASYMYGRHGRRLSSSKRKVPGQNRLIR